MENQGLVQKYYVSKVNGSPIDKNAEYFILRLDESQRDPEHRRACVKAILTYADAIKDHLPELSKDLIKKYS